jgi:hypothetical protein
MRNACKILVRNSEGKSPLGRLRCKWEDTINMDFKEIMWKNVDLFCLVQNRCQWLAAMNMDIRIS